MSTAMDAPQNLAAERSVIGGLLYEPAVTGDIAEILSAQDFYLRSHGLLFDFIIGEHQARRIPTVVEVEQFLKSEAGKVDISMSAIYDMIEEAPPSSIITKQYAGLIKQAAQRRELLTQIRSAKRK
jgi:replicative DNA helicase